MATATRQTTKHTVISKDGTEIAYWTSGSGRPLVLVHGTTGDHSRFGPLLPFLEPHATVVAMDRRGRGESGDGPSYSLEREFEDLAAIVDAVAHETSSKVDVYGHSYGGEVAWGAALITSSIRKLVLYEGWPAPNPEGQALDPEVEERMDALIGEGNRDAVMELFLREVVMLSDEDIEGFRSSPIWPARLAAAHTITREMRGFVSQRFDREEAAKITVPTLLLTGSETPDSLKCDPDIIEAALPDARIVTLEGQEHLADVSIPEVFAGHMVEFLREDEQT